MALEDDKYPNDYNEEEEEYDEDTDPNAVEIYAKRPIFWFSVFFTTIFGGIMLAMNLRNAGYIRAAFSVVLFAIGYYLLSAIVVNSLLPLITSFGKYTIFVAALISLATNVIGGLILTEGFYNKYFPDDDYYPRSINTPLMVAGGIFLLQFILASLIKMPGLTGM